MQKLNGKNTVAKFLTAVLSLLLMSFSLAVTAAEHDEHEEVDHVEMQDGLAFDMGIRTQIAAAKTLQQTDLLYGKITPDPRLVSHITARYPGLIREVRPALGDSVSRGDLLLTIEANDSLQGYQIHAPIDGTVIDIHANPGEFAGDQALITIANYQNVWADLNVFPGEAQYIKPGQTVNLRMDTLRARSEIRYLNPGNGLSPHVIAKVPVANPELNWTPGLLVEADVVVDQFDVPLAIDVRAVQMVHDEQVVFVKQGNVYRRTHVELGRSDRQFVEVVNGLNPGDEYVVEGSYLIKADLEKSGASHEH